MIYNLDLLNLHLFLFMCINSFIPQRFVNLVSHAINLCELQPKPGEIKYPNIQSHTEIFALEVKKTIESELDRMVAICHTLTSIPPTRSQKSKPATSICSSPSSITCALPSSRSSPSINC